MALPLPDTTLKAFHSWRRSQVYQRSNTPWRSDGETLYRGGHKVAWWDGSSATIDLEAAGDALEQFVRILNLEGVRWSAA